MARTSTEAKQRWNNAHYTQIKISVQPEIAAAFKAKCLADGVSMAGEISRFMSGQVGGSQPKKPDADSYATRQKRRKTLRNLTERLEAIRNAEQAYLENIPVNLQGAQMYEAAEHTVSVLEEAISLLSDAFRGILVP
jgi:phenylalanyl-tRNA synthetase alpha subunit